MIKLTQEIIDELNDYLNSRGYCFNFFFDDRYSNGIVNSYLKNAAGLDSYIINIDSSILKEISDWFKRRELKIRWNNTCSIFWLSEI